MQTAEHRNNLSYRTTQYALCIMLNNISALSRVHIIVYISVLPIFFHKRVSKKEGKRKEYSMLLHILYSSRLFLFSLFRFNFRYFYFVHKCRQRRQLSNCFLCKFLCKDLRCFTHLFSHSHLYHNISII